MIKKFNYLQIDVFAGQTILTVEVQNTQNRYLQIIGWWHTGQIIVMDPVLAVLLDRSGELQLALLIDQIRVIAIRLTVVRVLSHQSNRL